MKLLTKLEKSKSFWFLLIISTVFFILRLPSIIEPYWYGDEGIYQVIGQAINNGRVLYSEIWDNKPPLLYLIYALFGGDQQNIRMASLFVGLLSIISFFYLSKAIFRKLSTSIISTSVFAILFATPFIEGNIANAENFMLLPIITSALLIYKANPKHHESKLSALNSQLSTLFVAGLLLGIAFLFKIVGVFDFVAFLLFLLLMSFRATDGSRGISFNNASLVKRSLHLAKASVGMTGTFILGFLLPLLLTALYFLSQGALSDFIKGAFSGNVGYVGYGNKFLNIPQGLLIFKLLLLSIVTLLIFLKRNSLSKPMIFISLWLAFSLFNAFFSQRPYTHYVLVLLPSLSLFLGLIFSTKNVQSRIALTVTLILILFLVKENFWLNSFKKTALYYQNAFLFIKGDKDVKSYQSFFDRKTPRDYEVASFIKKHTNESDTIFIWGDSAQIYALSDKLPLNKYTVAYHIRQSKSALDDTQAILYEAKPKYIITLAESKSIPFQIKEYSIRYSLEGAYIYERNF